jgi:DNA polymerase, archaea type
MVRCLLDADYISREEKPVIRLFYKTQNGRETEEISDFKPYLYAIPKELDELKKEIKALDGFSGFEEVERTVEAPQKVLKVFFRHPKNIPASREAIARLKSCRGVREADIPFARRYVMDSGIVPMENFDKVSLNVASVDIEIAADGEPDSMRDPIHMISYSDSSGARKVWFWGRKNPGLDYAVEAKDESEMLRMLVDEVEKNEVDVITGYNTDNFDFPYIQARCEKKRIDVKLGAQGESLKLERRGMNNGAKITGRPHVDLYPICRQVLNLPRYQLEDVYEALFNKEKVDIKVEEIREFYRSKDDGLFARLCEYSMADADATLAIALKMLPLMYEMSRIIRQPLYETSRMGSGQRVEYLLIDEAGKKNILVPNRPSDEEYESRDERPYEGAFVVDPKKGIHDNIVLFDFRSLYPSIILSHNIDPSTMDCECCREKANMAPNGHYFCTNKKGFIPNVLKKLLDMRSEFKALMKAEADSEKKYLLDVKQQAMKLLANSMYGYYGFQRARWYCRQCAEAIAGMGRVYIQKTIETAKKHGFEVVYGDTDSVYLTKPDISDVDAIKKLSLAFQKQVNSELPEAMDLEYEGFYPRGVFITKKRYALIGEDGKLTIKGLETRRRDWCEISKKTQEKVLDALLKDRSPEKAANIVKDTVALIKTGAVPLEELAINTQMTRSLGGYVSEGPHIAAVRKAMKAGREYKQGDIITYVILKGNSSNIGDRAVTVDLAKEGEYDPDYYINNQVLPAVMRILEALGFQEDEMKGLGRQTTLGGW